MKDLLSVNMYPGFPSGLIMEGLMRGIMVLIAAVHHLNALAKLMSIL